MLRVHHLLQAQQSMKPRLLTWSVLHRLKAMSCFTPTRCLSSREIRKMFIDYFQEEHRHQFVPSSSVIPKKGEGTYFINAGMNQFKPIFLGTVDPDSEMTGYRRVVNSQKCVRLGGKHNDLKDVGQDGSHHTFFEMLGSWSFGDYFKTEACKMAWRLLTEVYCLPKDRLYVTYFAGDKKTGLAPDEECRQAWLDIGVPNDRVIPSGLKDNFWEMGATGPCGPCSEIHYDHVGGRDVPHLVNTGSPEVIELWNLVFTQFDRQADHSLRPLPKQHVDTGMGLERITAVLQGKTSNYDTDLFIPLFQEIHNVCKLQPYGGLFGQDSQLDTAYRIIADHTRMATVAIADGLLPGRAKLENKLRQIMHRNIKQAHTILQAPEGMLGGLVPVVVDILGNAFPEIQKNQAMVREVFDATEDAYLSNLESGRKVMRKALVKMNITNHMTADQMWDLYEGCYGQALPFDLIQELAEETGIKLDLAGFDKKLDSVKEQSRVQLDERKPQLRLDQHLIQSLTERGVPETDDSYKYQYTSDKGNYDFPVVESKVVAIVNDGQLVESVGDGTECGVILERTNFYSEAGGQVADRGQVVCKEKQDVSFLVRDVQQYSRYILHSGLLDGATLNVGDVVTLHLDQEHRECCMCNHTATHVINYALRQIVPNVQQRGSMVSAQKLTFDFNCLEAFGPEEISKLQEITDNIIQSELAIHRRLLPLDEAMGLEGLRTLQDEIYPQNVNVVSVGPKVTELLDKGSGRMDCSVELCGGTHVHNTRDIASVVITKVTSIAQGTKRITAVTGKTAIEAQESAEELTTLLEDFEYDLQTGMNQDTWGSQVKHMDRLFSSCLLPKLDKDQLFTQLDQLRSKVNEYKNQLVKEKVKKALENVIETEEQVIVQKFQTSDIKTVSQTLLNLNCNKPVMLAWTDKKLVKALACLPEGDDPQPWLEYVSEGLKDVKIGPVKGKGINGVFVLTALRGDLDNLLERGRLYFDKRKRQTR